MIIKNIKELQEFLSSQLTRISDQDITPAVANAQANIAGKMISAVKYQIEYNKMRGKSSEISFLET